MTDVLLQTEQYTHGGEIVLREPRDTLKASLAVDAMNPVSKADTWMKTVW